MARSAEPRVGIVGLGGLGQFHANHLLAAGRDLAGGVDVSADAREAFADEYGVSTYGTFEELVDPGVDAVVVTTPNRFHEEYAVAALERNVPVLVEKPLAHTVASAGRIVDAAEESDAFCMVGFHKRFLSGTAVLLDRIQRGGLGDVHHVEANYVRRRGVPGRGGWFTREAVAGGGALVDVGVHVLDLALAVLGFPAIESVCSTILSEFGSRHDYTYLNMYGEDRGPDRFDVEDSVRAFVRDAAGRSVSVNVAWAANQPNDTTLTVTGSDGGARLDHETGELELYDVADLGEPQLLTTRVDTRQDDPHRKELRAFLSAVAEGRAPASNTVREGYRVQQLVEAIYAAGETGGQVAPPETASGDLPAD